jgi:hypothetical protein
MSDNTEKDPLAEHPEVYTFLTDYYMYQDGLSWERTQLLVAVEAGAIASAFAVRQLAWVTLIVGVALIAVIWLIVERDWETRDQSLHLLDKVHDPLGIRMMKEPRTKWWRGSFLLRIVFAGFILLDIILAALFLLANHCDFKALLDVFRCK